MADPDRSTTWRARSNPSDRLMRTAFAAFHTAALTLVLVRLELASGGLGELLGSLGTAVGALIYGALWLTAWWATGRAMQGWAQGGPSAISLAGRSVNGVLWAAANGVAFMALVFGGGALARLVMNPPSSVPPMAHIGAIAIQIGVFLVFGALGAYLVGALVGALFVVVDAPVLHLAGALADRYIAAETQPQPRSVSAEHTPDGGD